METNAESTDPRLPSHKKKFLRFSAICGAVYGFISRDNGKIAACFGRDGIQGIDLEFAP